MEYQNERSHFLVNQVAMDWLTLTTYEKDVYNEFIQLCAESVDLKKSSSQKRMQYSGIGGNGYFWGKGLQEGREHYMMILSGIEAATIGNVWMGKLASVDCQSTRIDIQLTLLKEGKCRKTSEVGNAIRKSITNQPSRVGAPLSVKLVDSDKFNDDTVYIGSRSSNRYVRIYDKVSEGNEYLRYECEVKGDLAKRLYGELLTVPEALKSWLLGSIHPSIRTIPEIKRFVQVMEGVKEVHPYVEFAPSTFDTRMKWLNEQVMPSLVKMAMDGYDKEVIEWLDKVKSFV